MGSYHTYSIPGEAAALVPEFAVEDLFGRTAAQVPAPTVKDLGQNTLMRMDCTALYMIM